MIDFHRIEQLIDNSALLDESKERLINNVIWCDNQLLHDEDNQEALALLDAIITVLLEVQIDKIDAGSNYNQRDIIEKLRKFT